MKLRRRAAAMVSRIVGCSEADAARLVRRSEGDVKIAVLLGFGLTEVSSEMRVPTPPARMTAFMARRILPWT